MKDETKPRVVALGGIFFKSNDRTQLGAWYEEHLGIGPASPMGICFGWRELNRPNFEGRTVWSLFDGDTSYFAPSDATFMLNYIVADLDAMLGALEKAGVERVGEIDDQDYGRFAWILDPEGNKIELYQPKGKPFEANIPPPRHDTQRFFGARPSLGVRDVAASLSFYRDLLGFDVSATMGEPPSYAMLTRDAASLALVGVASPAVADFASVYVDVADVDHMYLALTGADVTIAHPLTSHPWGMTDFVVRDPDGHKIAIGQRKA